MYYKAKCYNSKPVRRELRPSVIYNTLICNILFKFKLISCMTQFVSCICIRVLLCTLIHTGYVMYMLHDTQFCFYNIFTYCALLHALAMSCTQLFPSILWKTSCALGCTMYPVWLPPKYRSELAGTREGRGSIPSGDTEAAGGRPLPGQVCCTSFREWTQTLPDGVKGQMVHLEAAERSSSWPHRLWWQ